MKSFAQKLKEELVVIELTKEEEMALLCGLLQVNSSINLSSSGLYLEFKTKNYEVANKVIELIKKHFKLDCELVSEREKRLRKEEIFYVRIHQNANLILQELDVLKAKNDSTYNLKKRFKTEEEQIAYIRGAFLACGSLNDPASQIYHMEIQAFNSIVASNLRDLLNSFQIGTKVTNNRRGFIVYCKSAERIGEFIQLVGAIDSLFEFQDVRIERDLVNSINRVNNCEQYNQNKATQSAVKQLKEIEVVEKYYLSNLPKSIKEICVLRKENPDDTLSELSEKTLEKLGKNISKSALAHRFKTLHELYLDAIQNIENQHIYKE